MKKIWMFHAVAFLGAFLLFQIQPMTSKALLPAFGGSYLVWGACMVFYQAVLLAGYAYAHAMQKWLGVARYARFHWILLVAPLLFFSSRLDVPDEPLLGLPLSISVLAVLLMRVGFPVFVFSTTSLILQRWLSASNLPAKDNPYVLYGASNLGSMLGLLTYPVILEPLLKLETQWQLWWAGYAVVALLQLLCAPWRGVDESEPVGGSRSAERLGKPAMLRYFLLGLAGSALLLAVTNVITLDIASVPFLWVLPLSVYLLSFVVTFKRKPWYPAWMGRATYMAVIVGVFLHLMMQLRLTIPAPFLILVHLLVLFVVCVGCNGELVSSKPEKPAFLTTFYLFIAAGGLAGSILVNLLIPVMSNSFVEYPVALIIGTIAIVYSMKQNAARTPAPADVIGRVSKLDATICFVVAVAALTAVPALTGHFTDIGSNHPGIVVILIAVPVALALLRMAAHPWYFAMILTVASITMNWTEGLAAGSKTVKRFRNFYGIYQIMDRNNIRYLKHGTTQHGREYISGPKAGKPMGYYNAVTPVSGILSSPDLKFSNVGMIGLGTGAAASYMREGQTITIFELDPDNLPIADEYFTYLRTARKNGANVRFVFGDGRVSLRKLKGGSLDLLLVDAFNSGSIPVHFMTVEAFEEYFRVLGKDGLLLLHVSNKTLDLPPVVYSDARVIGAYACEKTNPREPPDVEETDWMILSMNRDRIVSLTTQMGWNKLGAQSQNLPRPWTDQYSNLLGAMLAK